MRSPTISCRQLVLMSAIQKGMEEGICNEGFFDEYLNQILDEEWTKREIHAAICMLEQHDLVETAGPNVTFSIRGSEVYAGWQTTLLAHGIQAEATITDCYNRKLDSPHELEIIATIAKNLANEGPANQAPPVDGGFDWQNKKFSGHLGHLTALGMLNFRNHHVQILEPGKRELAWWGIVLR